MTADFFTQMRSTMNIQRALVNQMVLEPQLGIVDWPAPPPPGTPDLLTTRDVLRFATINGAQDLRLDKKTGSLTPGKEADIIILDGHAINVAPLNQVPGAVVSLMDRTNVETVIVAGKVRKWKGKLLDVDLPHLRQQLEASRDYIFAAAGIKQEPVPQQLRRISVSRIRGAPPPRVPLARPPSRSSRWLRGSGCSRLSVSRRTRRATGVGPKIGRSDDRTDDDPSRFALRSRRLPCLVHRPRSRRARRTARGLARRVWLVAGRDHNGRRHMVDAFVAMLAFKMPITDVLRIGLTILSLVTAIVRNQWRLATSSVATSLAASPRSSGSLHGTWRCRQHYTAHGGHAQAVSSSSRPSLVALSVVIANRRVDGGPVAGIPNHGTWATPRRRGRHGCGDFPVCTTRRCERPSLPLTAQSTRRRKLRSRSRPGLALVVTGITFVILAFALIASLSEQRRR